MCAFSPVCVILCFCNLSHRAGRHFRTKLMSRYIGAGQNGRFDMRIQELVSKVQNSGRLLRKKRFLGRLHPQPFLAVISACRLIMDIRAKKTNGVGPFFLIRQKHNFFQFSFSSAKHNSLYLLCSRPQDEVFFLKTEY